MELSLRSRIFADAAAVDRQRQVAFLVRIDAVGTCPSFFRIQRNGIAFNGNALGCKIAHAGQAGRAVALKGKLDVRKLRVVLREKLSASRTDEEVDAVPAVDQDIVCIAVAQDVAAGATVQPVSTGTTVEIVVAGTAMQDIVAEATLQRVVALAAEC